MEEKLKDFGFFESPIDGSELVFGCENKGDIPSEYSYREYMAPIINQYDDPICVPCSISAFLNWRKNLENGTKIDNNVRLDEIYSIKTTVGEGMTFKEAFKYLRHHGVETDFGTAKINTYAIVKNPLSLKYAIVENGPCVGALPVYNFSKNFWTKRFGDSLCGYHAISIIGYDANGFIIRNSWGTSFADGGYTYIKNEDFGSFIELWTVTD